MQHQDALQQQGCNKKKPKDLTAQAKRTSKQATQAKAQLPLGSGSEKPHTKRTRGTSTQASGTTTDRSGRGTNDEANQQGNRASNQKQATRPQAEQGQAPDDYHLKPS